MTTAFTQHRFLSRGIDYLGDLGAKLRDLQGFATLAHELIQNADDADGAGQMCFRVSETALIVDNDGKFSECEDVEAAECLWKQVPGRGLCDFHGFRSVASGHKREREGTTGAFGIGFISVYQITDRPELISAGRHWILHEDRPESERIEVCVGCSVCKAPELPNTRFILPWAFDANTTLRKALRAPALTPDAPKEFRDQLCRSLPTAMLFLKNLNAMEVFDEDKSILSFQRILEGDSLIVSDGTKDRIWHLLRGDFDETANKLRAQHAGRIEPKRMSTVTLAIPEDPFAKGLLCACLPAQETGLPFHINADFFPHSDRKRIIFEHDYQSDWNRAVIRAAADVLVANLDILPQKLGHQHLWHLLSTVQRVGEEANAERKEKSLGLFWNCLRPQLRQSKVFFTSRREWKTASEVLFLLEKEEEGVAPILEGLGLSLLHNELRSFHNLFSLKEVGVARLHISHLADALQAKGFDKRIEYAQLPAFLQTEAARRQLRRELTILLARKPPLDERNKLARCAVIPGRDHALWPCSEIYRADNETIALFSSIDASIPFLADLEEEAKELAALCPEFTPAVAVGRLARLLIHSDSEADAAKVDPVAVLGWFEDRREDVRRSDELKSALAALPLFPCSEGLKPLTSLSLPGDFTDPIGLAGVVDLVRLNERRDFLIELGAKRLTFARYAEDHIPRAFRQPEITAEQKRSVVRLLAERIGEIRDNDEIRRSLADLPIVECTDGQFRRPGDVYFNFNFDVVSVVLGDGVPLAVLPKHHESATQDLYGWLGVAASPRLEAVTRRIKTLTASPPTDKLVEAIGTIFRHLGDRLGQEEKTNPALVELRSLPWLPARGDRKRWHRPGDLYAVFQDYLFESQAQFLDLPREVQTSCSDLLSLLTVRTRPSTRQVVDHLIHCSQAGVIVNKEVYRFLNDAAADDAVLRLRDTACLILPDNSYVKPSQVFWGEHPFGRYRHRLGTELRKYSDLFGRLGVREGPSHEDALAVLGEISNEFGPPNRLLDEDTRAILLACWQQLERALREEQIPSARLAALSSTKVIPDARGLLNPPAKMFFEDRPGLSTKFRRFLDNDVIPRPQGAWRAMLEAGVRLLSTAVRTHLVECKDPETDEWFMGLLRKRRSQLLRVLEAGENASGQPDLGLLDRVQCVSVAELRVQYSVKAFNREVSSDPEDLPAKFQAADSTLYFVRRGNDLPWPSIARELALALCPEADPGRLAAGIKEVFAATSEDEAAAILDELGFARLAVAENRAAVESGVVVDLGGESTPSEQLHATSPGAAEEFATSGGSSGGDGRSRSEGATQPADEATTGTPIPPTDTPLPSEPQKRPESRPEGGRPEAGAPESGQQRDGQRPAGGRDGEHRPPRGGYPVLRSYVSPEDPEGNRVVDPVLAERRERVNRQGMNRVLEYERQHQRHPREMPPFNPGYDVESDNDTGQIERYIEVKSLSGDWEGPHAGMTNTQFEKNDELGDRYWLYVVERADQPDFKIWRIQNPAQRVTSFMFDDGWKNVAEQDDEEEAAAPAEPVEEQT